MILWKLGYYSDTRELQPIPSDFIFPPYQPPEQGELTLQWIGHATFLIRHKKWTILIDPVFAERASPLTCIGPKRHLPPALSLESVGSVDYILITHNHYDHLDRAACKWISHHYPGALFIVPLGLKEWFNKQGISHVCELDWWKTHAIGPGTITAVPAQHFSGRGLFDRNKTLWCGYMVEIGGKRLYLAGDTGYNMRYFTQIRETFPNIDLSIIPIGAYIPRKFMHPMHVDPKEALQIHVDVGSKLSIGSHFGTFRLGDEPLDQPAYELYLEKQKNASSDTFHLLAHGQTISWG